MLANHDGAGKEVAHFLTQLTKVGGEMVLRLKNGEAEDGGAPLFGR
jgi:hypothetical protein